MSTFTPPTAPGAPLSDWVRAIPDWPQQGVLFRGLREAGKREDSSEIFVRAFDAAARDQPAHGLDANAGMMQQIGQRHGLRPRDGDA